MSSDHRRGNLNRNSYINSRRYGHRSDRIVSVFIAHCVPKTGMIRTSSFEACDYTHWVIDRPMGNCVKSVNWYPHNSCTYHCFTLTELDQDITHRLLCTLMLSCSSQSESQKTCIESSPIERTLIGIQYIHMHNWCSLPSVHSCVFNE